MTLHRFFSGETKDRGGVLELTHELWVNDPALVNQVLRVLRMRVGEELVLFDGKTSEVLYKISETEPQAFHLQKVTDLVPKLPPKKVTLAWSLLKKDKNEWVMQKATELGVSHFVPLITDRTEKLGFDSERAHSIVVEASEQCGRHDVPSIQEPMKLREFIGQHAGTTLVFFADMDGETPADVAVDHVVVVVGPEGGWTDEEREFFKEKGHPFNRPWALHLTRRNCRNNSSPKTSLGCILSNMKKLVILDADGVLINGERFSAVMARELNTNEEREKEFFMGPFQDCLVGKADLRESLLPYLKDFGWDGTVDEFSWLLVQE